MTKYIFIKDMEDLEKFCIKIGNAKETDIDIKDFYGYGAYYKYNKKWRINSFPTIFKLKKTYIVHMPINEILKNEESRKEYAKWIKKAINLESFLNE